MTLRKVLLKTMLWSLGFAAVAGVAAVFLSGHELVWRVVGTGLVTAVASGLLMATSSQVDRENTRVAGLLGMTAVVAEFVMAMLLIWEIPRALANLRVEEELALTMVCSGVAALLVMFLARLRRSDHGVDAVRLGTVVTLLSFGCTLMAAWKIGGGRHGSQWWETAWIVFLTGGLAALCLLDAGRGPVRRILGLIATVLALVIGLSGVWLGSRGGWGTVSAVICVTVAALVAHANLCLLCPLKPEQHWLRWVTIAAALVAGGVLDFIVADENVLGRRLDHRFLERVASAAGIVTACGTLALAVLARLNRRVRSLQDATEFTDLLLVCPRCQKKQHLSAGASACGACGLCFTVAIEIPRCPQCAYQLYGPRPQRCPECGMTL